MRAIAIRSVLFVLIVSASSMFLAIPYLTLE
jgi:hypothetical protein